jgi:hypothetical protein
MISYFKYDNGNAFTLDGSPYVGYFHIIDDIAYSGKKPSGDSQKLLENGNFISDSYLNKATFSGVTPVLDLAVPNALDILNEDTLSDLLERVDENNLKIYQNNIFINSNTLPYDYKNTYFYTLTATPSDIRLPDDLMYGKNVYTHSDPFSFSEEWEFLDRVTTGSFIVDESDNFIYYCIADNNIYALSGTFNDPTKKLELLFEADGASDSSDLNNLKIEQGNHIV